MCCDDCTFVIQQVCKAFNGNCDIFTKDEEPVVSDVSSLKDAIKLLRIQDFNKFELNNILEDGNKCMLQFSKDLRPPNSSRDDLEEEIQEKGLKVSFLIGGSEKFRQLILKLVTDPIYCALVNTHLADLVSPKQLKVLSRGIVDIKTAEVGATIYSTKTCNQEWFVLISGKLHINIDNSSNENSTVLNETPNEEFEIWKGEIFGGFDFFENDPDPYAHFDVAVLEPCQFIELKGNVLEELLEEDPDVANDVYDMLGKLIVMLKVFACSFLKFLILGIRHNR